MVRPRWARIGISTFGLLVLAPLLHAQQPYDFGACADRSRPEYKEISVRSLYIPMRDGVKIAVDVILPKDLAPGKKIPAILMMTRYWRSREYDEPTKPTTVAAASTLFFANHGYAMVTGDSRGTGASFGVWPGWRLRDETRDFGEIVSWIVAQPWSDGQVGAYGVSYTANSADWIAQNNYPAVKAIVPRFPDFDVYADEYFPGGIFNAAFAKRWSASNRRDDLNVPRGNPPRGVKPVDEDTDGHLLQQAIEQRKDIPETYEGLRQVTFRDDRPTTWGASMNDLGISSHVKDLERSRVAMYSQGSWLDAGTADGVLKRFVSLPNPQRALIGPWFHGGVRNANPFLPPKTPADPSPEAQLKEALCYFDHYLKGIPNGMSGRLLIYYTMGEEKWKTTKVWPPAGSTRQRWYLAADRSLSRQRPKSDSDADQYRVDFEVTNAGKTRWLPLPSIEALYPDRAEQDRRLLAYTTDPLAGDVEITGHPVVSLYVTSTATDGAFFVYLEDIDPAGKVTYITEGELRALHRKVSKDRPPHKMLVPYHSFLRKDASPLVPGEIAELHFGLLPTSVLVKKGHRLRITIAGADKDTFARIPENETPLLSVLRHKRYASFIDLPIIRRH